MNSPEHPHHHGHDMTNSHLLAHGFEYYEPGTLDEAIGVLSRYGQRARVLAGGTFLLVQMKMEQQAPECLVNVGKLPGLAEVRAVDGHLEIGALASIWDLRKSAAVQGGYTALAEACAAFGSTQIQLTGTIGGNVCNGSPASDTVPALAALDAELVLVGPDGERTLPVERFLVGPGETAIEDGELVRAIMLPDPEAGAGSAFVKISRVRADLAKASAAARIVREGECIVDCRLAFGSVGPTVIRACTAEQMLIGQTFSVESALAAGRAAAEEVAPIDDVRSSAWYRREVVKALTHDVLQAAWERAARGRAARERGSGAELRSARAEGRGVEALDGLRLGPEEGHTITLTVNGQERRLTVVPNELLVNVLRERLDLTGTKYGCGIGECGACTVLLDGVPTLSCLTLAVAADGSEVTTVEGLEGAGGELDALQEAFIEHAAFQCGYCTPGMLMMTKHLLEENPRPSEEDIRDYLKGNRCRCTGFAAIVRAVESCVEQ
ncbi:MAG: FAD binding domain-containing protein [Chloroflexota bacterium]|nr:FAD binding domain-containing protein [Chloroflexota bacterium]